MNLSETRHKKVKYRGNTYYISRYKEGDAHIHESRPYDKQGYGGDIIKFLLEDGTIDEVRGPYCCDGLFDFGKAEKLAKYLDDPSLLIEVTKLIVGNNLFLGKWGGGKREVLFEETDFIPGNYKERIKSEWDNMEIQVCIRGGSFYIRPNERSVRCIN